MPRQDDKFAQSPVRVYDAYGRERLIDRKVWRDQILPQNIRNNWHNAEILYTLLAEALGDGYEADIWKLRSISTSLRRSRLEARASTA